MNPLAMRNTGNKAGKSNNSRLNTKADDCPAQVHNTGLQKANIQMGIHQVEQIAKAVPVENSIRIKRRSVMGTEIPKVEYEKKKQAPAYSFYHTRMSLDEACQQFEKVKELTIRLAEIENSAYRLFHNSLEYP